MDASAIARHFSLGAAVRLSDGPVARGKQGVVWRLDTTEGRWAIKVPFLPAEDGGTADFQEAACAAGVPAPRVRRTGDGHVFAAVDGVPVRVYEWVDLGAPDPNLDPELVGAALAALHGVHVDTAGPVHPWYTEPVGAPRWDELIAALHREGAPFADRLAALRDELVALESWIEPPTNLQICHRDLWADNVLPTADGGLCVIDWENSGAADPAQELACALFEFARHDRGRARALTAAYRSAGGPATLSRHGDFSMLIAQLGHITEAAASDWLSPGPRSPDRAAATAWISEVLDDPHSRDQLSLLFE
ncbi:phosphotransferase [Couchioplanes caeruleus]|uniref:phosphotransferase enzyme family protein n=1 Tax=Couchioplanes caeruleus TaxID=56438 RepID=UPI0020BDA849|nr:phosphotransferase [Couchioplanes caeruleus]UQU65835.1 phosphotransferase [Couchioplanes caeruleus]